MICLNPECCAQQVYSRGLCQSCYAYAHRHVKYGDVTWAELEAAERSLPAKKRRGCSSKNAWFGISKGAK